MLTNLRRCRRLDCVMPDRGPSLIPSSLVGIGERRSSLWRALTGTVGSFSAACPAMQGAQGRCPVHLAKEKWRIGTAYRNLRRTGPCDLQGQCQDEAQLIEFVMKDKGANAERR